MKQCIILCLLALAGIILPFTTSTVYAQQNQQQVQILKPKMALSEVAFVVQLLDNIEIRGNEVDAFMDVRKVLIVILENAQKDKKTATDVVTVEMNIGQAQNLLALMQRSKMTGADAERFRKVVDTIVASAQQDEKKGK
jgi:hypothetical protein